MVDSKLVEAVRLLVGSCNPQRVILFGSQARGDAKEDSDIDILVTLEQVEDVAGEIVRLGRELSKIRFYADLVVTTVDNFDYWRETPGHIYYAADHEGKILYEKVA